jgi:homoserine kinase type II
MAILTRLDPAELEALAATYSLGALARFEGVQAGTVNTSYALELAAGRYFLRIYEEQGVDGARAEAAMLDALAARGVATPAPVVDRAGRTVQTVRGKAAVLFPWVEGQTTCQAKVTGELTWAVGRALAELHLSGVPAPGEGRFDAASLLERCARVDASDDAEARARAPELRARLAESIARRDASVPRGLIHGDLFRDNVLVGVDGAITALLDFESAHDGPFIYDVAVSLLAWCWGSSLDRDLGAALVRGYASRRELSAAERDALFEELRFGCARFMITRITDETWKNGKKWQRFAARLAEVEALGPRGVREALAP